MTSGGVVISFAHQDKSRAAWLAGRLRTEGFAVLTEDDFGAESPRLEMARAVEGSDVVVAMITPSFPGSRGAQRELDMAEGLGKPVVALYTGLESRNGRAAPYRAYRRIELSDSWDGTDQQWAQILELLVRALTEQRSRSRNRPVLDRRTALATDQAFLLYDIEDRALAFSVLRARPGWQALGKDSDEDPEHPRVLLWTIASAERYSLAARDLDAAPASAPVFLVRNADSPAPPPGMLAIPVDRILAQQRPAPESVASPTTEAARRKVDQLLERVREKSHGMPLDAFTERFCEGYPAASAAEDAYELAVRWLPAGDVLRLRAVYTHALALRFYGDWRAAVAILAAEADDLPGPLTEAAVAQWLRIRLEQLNLEYELGDHPADDVDQHVKDLQRSFRELTDLHGYVQAGRVLGNVLREQGEFDSAERVLQRITGVAEYLAEHSGEGAPGELLLADCHRELAGLYLARRDHARAAACLAEARDQLCGRSGARSPARDYMLAALDYVEATLVRPDEVLVKATSPTEQAQAALATLARFGNPIRTAAVFDWLGQAWTRQVPRRSDDLARGEEYLRKALRIREKRGHSYSRGLSHLSLGRLYEAIDDLGGEIRHYEMSQHIFEELGVQPVLARAHAALADAYFRKALAGDAAAKAQYQNHLARAEALYRDIHLEGEGIELRYELEHGGRRPVEEVADDTPLIAVGEYLLHRWIRAHTASVSLPADPQFRLVVGIGDDAAVLAPANVEPGHGLVFTTDSAPGSVCRIGGSPAYAARFAIIQTLADIIAMGARPVALLVNIFLSRAATVGYVKRLIDAVFQDAARYGVPIIGGDIKEREEQSVGCVGIGCVDRAKILTRDGARPGDAVGITLAAHPSGTGARLIGARWAQELAEHYRMNSPAALRDFPALADIVDPMLKYDLLCVPATVMASATSTGRLRAAMDTSDGVLACLEIMGRESNVAFELDEAAIAAIVDPRAEELANLFELPPATFLFSAGHDWEIVFTCAEEDFAVVAREVDRELRGHGKVARIGTATERTGDSEHAIQLRRLDGTMYPVQYYTDEKFVPRVYQDRPGQWLGFASHLRPVGERQPRPL